VAVKKSETFIVEGPDVWERNIALFEERAARESVRSPTDDTCVVVAEALSVVVPSRRVGHVSVIPRKSSEEQGGYWIEATTLSHDGLFTFTSQMGAESDYFGVNWLHTRTEVQISETSWATNRKLACGIALQFGQYVEPEDVEWVQESSRTDHGPTTLSPKEALARGYCPVNLMLDTQRVAEVSEDPHIRECLEDLAKAARNARLPYEGHPRRMVAAKKKQEESGIRSPSSWEALLMILAPWSYVSRLSSTPSVNEVKNWMATIRVGWRSLRHIRRKPGDRISLDESDYRVSQGSMDNHMSYLDQENRLGGMIRSSPDQMAILRGDDVVVGTELYWRSVLAADLCSDPKHRWLHECFLAIWEGTKGTTSTLPLSGGVVLNDRAMNPSIRAEVRDVLHEITDPRRSGWTRERARQEILELMTLKFHVA
jgi:hypothetical protein